MLKHSTTSCVLTLRKTTKTFRRNAGPSLSAALRRAVIVSTVCRLLARRCLPVRASLLRSGRLRITARPQKITFAEMRDMGVRGLLVFYADYQCSHSIAISGDPWPDDLRLSDIEERFICRACGRRGARRAAGLQTGITPAGGMGYRSTRTRR